MAHRQTKDGTYEYDSDPDPGALNSAANTPPNRNARAAQGTRRHISDPNAQALKRIGQHAAKRGADVGRDHESHAKAREKLSKTIGRLALISENLRDRSGIESTVEVVKPLSRRQHNVIRAGRVRLFAGFTPPDTFDLGQYMRNAEHEPNQPPDPNAVQFRVTGKTRAWVLPFVRQPDVVSRRQQLTPSRNRPNDLIIEIPRKGQDQARSWMGGVEAYDGMPPTGKKVPRVIAVGPDGEGTFFSPRGLKGVSTGYHGDHAMEDFTATNSSDPNRIENQTHKTESLTNRMLDIQGRVLDRIGEENGANEMPEREVPRPPHLPPPAY